jgi:uncharacterized protein
MTHQNTACFFVTDLHGIIERYEKLFRKINEEKPGALFIGGDILPSPFKALTAVDFSHKDFINGYLVRELKRLKQHMGDEYPRIFVILGNDDGRMEESSMLDAASRGVWEYCHNRRIRWGDYWVYGYSYVPPTPFRLKDWERYDVSRYVDPGCIAPADGMRSVPISDYELHYGTISEDLEKLAGEHRQDRAIYLFHTPPYKTKLDRAALDGKMIDYVPLDVHLGSIAVKRFIEERHPLITLHGHIHESTRLTGYWYERIEHTHAMNAAHDGPELCLVRFDPHQPEKAERQLI